MATEEFLSCLSKTAIERVGSSLNVLPRQRVKDSRAFSFRTRCQVLLALSGVIGTPSTRLNSS
jgi:hypothetical protein